MTETVHHPSCRDMGEAAAFGTTDTARSGTIDQPFRFVSAFAFLDTHLPVDRLLQLDFPQEIRDCIYAKLLTSKHEQPCQVHDKVQHHVEPQILRVNKQIYKEAKDVMLRANLFVKLSTNLSDLEEIIHHMNLPLVVEGKAAEAFDCHVLHSIIRTPSFDNKNAINFVILALDHDKLCQGIETTFSYTSLVDECDRHTAEVTVTLVNPFETKAETDNDTPMPSLSMQVKESLLEPYRSHLKGYKGFEIKGDFPEYLKRAAMIEVQSKPQQTPQDILDAIRSYKELGQEQFDQGDMGEAQVTWLQGCLQLNMVDAGPNRKELQQAGGGAFADELTKLHFDICLNLAGLYVQLMRQSSDNPQYLQRMFGPMLHVLHDGTQMVQVFGSTWLPSEQQVGQLYYRVATATRLSGNRGELRRALTGIQMAVAWLPGDQEILAERDTIFDWAFENTAMSANPDDTYSLSLGPDLSVDVEAVADEPADAEADDTGTDDAETDEAKADNAEPDVGDLSSPPLDT